MRSNKIFPFYPRQTHLFLLFAILISFLLTTGSSFASSLIVVDSLTDAKIGNDGICTLREAIIAANQDKKSSGKPGECEAGNGADTIMLPAGNYLLSRSDNGKEDSSNTGDLDIVGDLTIIGDGADVTYIDGSGITDRIIHVIAGQVTISGVTIQNGNVSNDLHGGGIYNEADLTLIDSVVRGNTAVSDGGGIYNIGTLTVTGSTIMHNTAGNNGGGVATAAGSASYENSTLSDNHAVNGGGIAADGGSTELNNVTIAENTAVSGGGLYSPNTTLELQNSLVGDNLSTTANTADCAGSFHSLGHNLIEDGSDCTISGDQATNLLGVDPHLESLTGNGGHTPTYALAIDSPAVEAGNNATCAEFDQRGISRPRGITCDIGAFELENPPQAGPELFVNTANDVDDGLCGYDHCSLREAIHAANAASDLTTISFNIPDGNLIAVASPLPDIVYPVVINGTTQQPEGLVILEPASDFIGDGLVVRAGSSEMTGLEIRNFTGSGIVLLDGGDNFIYGNTIAYNGENGITIIGVTGNRLSANNIHDNGGLSVDLGGDGRTNNDTGDGDDGANVVQNFPVLQSAVPGDGNLAVAGRLNSSADGVFTIEFFGSDSCSLTGSGEQTFLGATTAATDATGDVYFSAVGLTAVSDGTFISATATDANGNTSEFSDCIVAGPQNVSWLNALPLGLAGDLTPTVFDQKIDQPGQSRWFKVAVEPGSKLIVTLTDLPENYDLTVYKDIGLAYADLVSPQDLDRLGAEFAPDAFSPDAFSPDAFSPDAFSPDAFSPDAFSPDAFSPDAFSPDAFSPDAFSPDAFSPDAFSPDAFSPDAFSGAQLRSLVAVSAFRGTAGEGVVVNTWNNTGFYYMRVRGANGVFNQQHPFHLTVAALSGTCGSVEPITTPFTHSATAGGYKTIILTDSSRLVGTPAEVSDLQTHLNSFAARSEVAGVIVDLGSDARVKAANAQADAYLACPYAKNLVAGTIKEIVDTYRALNPLQYVVIVGDDGVVPFFRYPDNAMLANEQNYVPPVRDASASQASLRLGYVMGQDAYGSGIELSSKNSTLPIPELAVGRLVENAADAVIMLDAYALTTAGQVNLTTNPAVTGYDFLEDAALAVQKELEDGSGAAADTLIADRDLSPEDPGAWTADDLRNLLLGERHDLIFLGGHFSAHSTLAADYTTRLQAAEVANAAVDLQNVIVFSAGCHAGYNLVDADGIPLVTPDPDWAQAFAQKGATLISGTGYQYGDTDFIEYSERLYLEFSRELRTGTGPVSIGQAMVAAKQSFLADTAQLRGIHEKSLIEATLFGFPMLQVDMPGLRITLNDEASVVGGTTLFGANPGSSLGLRYADVSVTPLFTEHTVELTNVADGTAVSAFYLSAGDGVFTGPAEPILPLEQFNVSAPGTTLRGVGFRGGSYTDLADILPLSGAPTTEIRGVHAPFIADVFYPVQPWRANYFDALATSDGDTRLSVLPAQFRSAGSQKGVLRRFDDMAFRLYYNDNMGIFAAGSIPALAGPPTVVQVTAVPQPNNTVDFEIKVVGNPASGVQEVWVTYTADSGPFAGQWQSLDLIQNQDNSVLWEGSLDLNGTNADDVRYMVQAANGVGLLSLATNLGAYYIPGVTAFNPAPTELSVSGQATSGAYGSQATFTAVLTSEGTPVADKVVSIGIGPQTRLAITNGDGEATVTLSLLGIPDLYDVRAAFIGDISFAAGSAATSFTIFKQDSVLTLAQPSVGFPNDTALLTATLTDANGRTLGEKTVFFVVSGPGGTISRAVITDYAGRATLDDLQPLLHGTYTVDVYFAGSVPLHTGETATYDDPRYHPTITSGTLTLLNRVPLAVDDSYSVAEDSTLVVSTVDGVLSNDTDGDGDDLTAVLATPPVHGLLTLDTDGSFTYVPDANFNGSDSFTYRADDERNESAVATVTIVVTAVNDVPTTGPDTYSVDQDTTLFVPAPGVLVNDGDIDGDGLTAVLAQNAANGSVTLAGDGGFVYVPNPGFYGNDSFSYRASDGTVVSAETTVFITVNFVNTPPVCGDAYASVDAIWPADNEMQPVSIMGVSDADGHVLTWTITGIYQDEPVGKGKHSPDGKLTGANTFEVRAERDGNGNGRVYHIFFTADDGYGGSCSGEVLVPIVPHDQSGNVSAIDEGALYDSTVRE